MRSCLSVAIFSAFFAFAPLAFADGDNAATADRLFKMGKDAISRGDLQTACGYFAESQKLDPAVGTLLNLADCEDRSGKLVSALAHFRAARASLAADDFRIGFADDHIASVARRVPKVIVREPSPAADLHVTCDGTEISPTQIGTAMPLDPGNHLIEVREPGHVDASVQLTLHEGQEQVVEATPGPLGDAVTTREREHESPRDARDETNGTRTAGFILAGAGAVGIVVGTITGIMTASAASTYKAHCDSSGRCDSTGLDAASTGRTTSVVSPVTLILGAAAGGAGIYFIVTSPAGRTTTVAPTVGRDSAGITLSRSF